MGRVGAEHRRVAQARPWNPQQAVPTVSLLGSPALTKAEGHGCAGKRAVAVLPRYGPCRGGCWSPLAACLVGTRTFLVEIYLTFSVIHGFTGTSFCSAFLSGIRKRKNVFQVTQYKTCQILQLVATGIEWQI